MAVKKTLQFFLQPLLKKFFQDMGRDPNNLEMILIRQKAGQQLKDSEKIIQFPQKRSFAEEIEAMKKSGDLADVNNLKKNDNVLRREMFRDSNLNKDKSIMGQIDERMNNINKASKRLDEIKKEIDEMYRPKTDAEIKAKLEKQNKDAVERMKKKKDDEPEDRATGGRAGFNTGGASNPNKRQGAVEEKTIDPRTSTQPDDNRPQSVNTTLPTGPAGIETIVTGEDDFDTKGFLSRVRKKNQERYLDLLNKYQVKDFDAIYDFKPSPITEEEFNFLQRYGVGQVYRDLSKSNVQNFFEMYPKGVPPRIDKDRYEDSGNFKFNFAAEGGRIGYYTGGITDVEPSLDDIGHGADSLMSRTRLMSPGSQATTSTGLNYLLAEDNDNLRVPFSKGNTVEDKIDEMIAFYQDYLKKGGKMDLQTFSKKYIPENFAEGGRTGFANGGMGRRAFLKLLAALTGGVAAAKSGILSLGGKEVGKKTVTETIKKSAGSGQPPPYFFELMETISKNGKEIKSYGERVKQTVAPSKDGKSELLMTEDLNTGSVQIKKIHKEGDDMVTKSEEMNYTRNMGDESTKGKPVDDYEEITEYNSRIYKDQFNEPDYVEGVDVENIVKEVDVNPQDVGKIKYKPRADGGRIGFSAGSLAKLGITGSSRRFLEKVFGKEKFATMIENDPDMHRGMLEVVEMFRKKDKEGLKMYLQKFLPHMDDATVEDFIIGSGDTSGIQGQLIRLGSGRDYRDKLQMIKEAENVRKLEDFDIEGVSKNAEGGRIELKGGGDALKAIINYFAKQAGKKGSDQLRDINPKVLPSGIENIMGPEHMNMLKKNQTDYLESLLSIIKSDKQFLDNVNKRVSDMKKNAPEGFEDVSESIGKQMVRSFMKDSPKLDRLKVYDKINIDDAIVDVEQMIKNRRVKESDGRVLNASGGLQTMLGE